MALHKGKIIDQHITKEIEVIQQTELYDKGEIQFNLVDSTPPPLNFSDIVIDTDKDHIVIISHGIETGLGVTLTTDGTLPTGLGAGVVYYTIKNSDNLIKLASTYDNAINNIPIDLVDGGSGTHTLISSTLSPIKISVFKSADKVNWAPVIYDVILFEPQSTVMNLDSMVLPFIKCKVEIASGQLKTEAYIYMKKYIN